MGGRSDVVHDIEMRIRLLGIGTPTASLRRMSPGYVIEVEQDGTVDHRFGAASSPTGARNSCNAREPSAFYLHYDHRGDYPRVVLTRWDQAARKVLELRVFGPKPLSAKA